VAGNSWCRLWHDMPNDPKWRTIARAAGARIPEVLGVFLHLMVDASQRGANANERGRTQVTDEDIGSALDLPTDTVSAIRQAMQGRVLDGDRLMGWSQRQPIREDDSAARARAWREEQRLKAEAERNRTLDSDADSDAEDFVGKASTHPQGIEGNGGGGGEPQPVRPEVAMAIALRKHNIRVTSQHPDLIAAAAEGVTVQHLTELAELYPGKSAGYLLSAARRERAEPAKAVTASGQALAKPRQVAGHSPAVPAPKTPAQRFAEAADRWNDMVRAGTCSPEKAREEIAKARANLLGDA
jgi:hypothetical protein